MSRTLRLGVTIELVAVVTSSVGAQVAGADAKYAFQAINAPGAGNTVAMANNASGDIVGYYTDANKVYHGFLLHGGAFTTLDYPGADVAWSQAEAINDAGDIAGNYSLKTPAPAGNTHAFLRAAAGKWSNVDYPEGTHLMQGGVYGILADGTVLGCYHDGNPPINMFGFTNGPKGVTSQAYPQSAPFSMHYGATPDGKTTVGAYISGAIQADNWHGYLVEGGTLVSFDVPGKVGTQAMGISPGRTVAGMYRVAAGTGWTSHGFVAETNGSSDPAAWSFSLVDVPDAAQTVPRALNARGELVGYYYDAAGTAHGFVATVAAASPPAAVPTTAAAPAPPNTGSGATSPARYSPPVVLATALLGLSALALASTVALRRRSSR